MLLGRRGCHLASRGAHDATDGSTLIFLHGTAVGKESSPLTVYSMKKCVVASVALFLLAPPRAFAQDTESVKVLDADSTPVATLFVPRRGIQSSEIAVVVNDNDLQSYRGLWPITSRHLEAIFWQYCCWPRSDEHFALA